MEFAAMKRRDLLELCRQHGLATRGSKADLAAGLAGALSLQGRAAAAESVTGVVVGKGCLKRLGGSASDGTSGASKKVRFALDETSEVKGQRRRSQVILSLVAAKTRGRRKARKALLSAAVSGRGRRRKRNDGGGSAYESVTGEVGADAPVIVQEIVVSLHAHSGVESQNNPVEAEEGEEVVGTATRRKQKREAQENVGVIANSRAGISRRITRSLSLSAAAVLLPPDTEEKRGVRKVGDSNDELPAEEQDAGVQDLTIAASPVITESSSIRKGKDCIPSMQKSSKVVVSCRTTRLSSVAADVILPTVVGKKRRKTRGRPKAREALPAAALGRRGSRQKCDVAGNSFDHGAFREVGADAPVTQSGTKAVNLRAESGVESQNNLAEPEEEEEAVEATTYRKQTRKIHENAEDISANAPSGISYRRARKSCPSTAVVMLSSVIEKMEVGDDNDELGVKKLAGLKVLSSTALPIIAESRSKRKEEDYAPADLKPAKVELYGRTTISHSAAADVLSPTVIGSKARKAEDVQPNREVPIDLEVRRNDAPITKSLRNRVVQINNSVVDETHVCKKLVVKRKPSRPATHGHQLLVPSVEEKEQVAVPCKFSQHRRSSRNHPQPDALLRNTDLENNKLSRVPVRGKDLSIAHRLTRNTAKTRLEDVESLSSGFRERITRSYKDNIARNGGRFSLSDDNSNKASAAETVLGMLHERTKGMHESVSNKEFQNAKGGDVGKQPAVRGCVRRSTRKSGTSVRN